MKKLLACAILLMFCSGCETIDAVNPVVQAGKIQNNAKQVTDEVTQIHNYALEMQRQELEQLTISED